MNQSQSACQSFGEFPLYLVKLWSIPLTVFWLVYDSLAFFVVQDPLPVQGMVLCTLGNLAVVSLLLVFVQPRLAGILTTLFALSAMLSVVFFNWDSIGLVAFGLMFFILPLLIPGLLLALQPGLFANQDLTAGTNQIARGRARFYPLALAALLSLLLVGVLLLGIVSR